MSITTMTTHQLKVQTPSPQQFVDWVLEQGQFCPNSGKELLQAAMIIQNCLASLRQLETSDTSQISDGYHTFAELYEHRHALMLALMHSEPDSCWFSRYHADGQLPFGSSDWFIAGAELTTGPITYHLPIRLWETAACTGAPELSRGMAWDGHSAADVVQRLMAWAVSAPEVKP